MRAGRRFYHRPPRPRRRAGLIAGPVPDMHLRRHEDSRVPGQGDPRAVRRTGSARRNDHVGGGGGRHRPQARWRGQRRQGADPRRRPRQGRRRQGGQEPRGGGEGRRPDPGHAARHAPDRPGRAEGRPHPRRGGPADRARALLRDAHRSRHAVPGAHGQLRRRHGHRGGGGEDPAPHPQGVRGSRRRADRLPGPQARLRHRARGGAGRPGRQAAAGALRGVHRHRRLARRDQPADRHRRTATCSRSTRR